MKPFSLEEYLKNPEKKVMTKSGLNARIICTDRKDLNYPIVVLIENKLTEREGVLYYTKEGKIFTDGLNDADLFFASEKKEGWINMYKNKDGISWIGSEYFKSKEEAEKEGKMICTCSVTTIKIEWEEEL